MSQIASFYVLTKGQLQQLETIAKDLPPKPSKGTGRIVLRVVPTEEGLSESKKYSKFWDFLHKQGKEPYRFNWSGSVMCVLLAYLVQKRRVDLTQTIWGTGTDTGVWYLFDNQSKTKYLEKLNPSKYRKDELREWLQVFAPALDFPEAGTAMFDGIRIIHAYLSLVDEKSIVLFHIG